MLGRVASAGAGWARPGSGEGCGRHRDPSSAAASRGRGRKEPGFGSGKTSRRWQHEFGRTLCHPRVAPDASHPPPPARREGERGGERTLCGARAPPGRGPSGEGRPRRPRAAAANSPFHRSQEAFHAPRPRPRARWVSGSGLLGRPPPRAPSSGPPPSDHRPPAWAPAPPRQALRPAEARRRPRPGNGGGPAACGPGLHRARARGPGRAGSVLPPGETTGSGPRGRPARRRTLQTNLRKQSQRKIKEERGQKGRGD